VKYSIGEIGPVCASITIFKIDKNHCELFEFFAYFKGFVDSVDFEETII
jgi:hypothetical protein